LASSFDSRFGKTWAFCTFGGAGAFLIGCLTLVLEMERTLCDLGPGYVGVGLAEL
jgi:hypothetical protein